MVGRCGQHVLTGLQSVEGKLKSHDDDAFVSFCLAVSQTFVFRPVCLLDLQNSSTEKHQYKKPSQDWQQMFGQYGRTERFGWFENLPLHPLLDTITEHFFASQK